MSNSQTFSAKYLVLFVVFFLILIYSLTLRGVAGNVYPNGVGEGKINPNAPPFETSLEKGRFSQTISLAEKHTFNVDEYADFLRPDLAWYNGHYYSAFPPGVAVLAVPLYLIGKQFGFNQLVTYSISAIFSLFTVLVMIKIAQKVQLSKRATLLSVLIFAVGSFAFAYSVNLSAHPISAFLISICFLMSVYIEKGGKNLKFLLVLWFTYSLNLFIDYPNLLILFPLMVITTFKAIDLKKIENKIHLKIPLSPFYGTIAFLPVFLLFINFNMSLYNKPITFTNRYNLQVLNIQGVKYDKLSNDLFSKKSYSGRFNFARVYNGIDTLLFSSDRGLFFFAPIFLLSIIGFIVTFYNKEKWGEIVLFTFIMNLIVYVGSFIMIILFITIISMGFIIASKAKDPFGRLLAGGITSYLAIQMIINLGAQSALFPLTGVPLPFISYGGSALVINLCSIGILLNISKQGSK